MVKISEKKTIKNGKEYKQYMITLRPTVIKQLGWKAGDEVDIKTDPQGTYAVVEKII